LASGVLAPTLGLGHVAGRSYSRRSFLSRRTAVRCCCDIVKFSNFFVQEQRLAFNSKLTNTNTVPEFYLLFSFKKTIFVAIVLTDRIAAVSKNGINNTK
jgi:hypothetical protein